MFPEIVLNSLSPIDLLKKTLKKKTQAFDTDLKGNNKQLFISWLWKGRYKNSSNKKILNSKKDCL